MEFEKERDREFRKKEAEKNRRHELDISKIFESSMNNSQQQRDFRYTLLIKLPFFNIRFNTLQIFIMLQVPLASPPMPPQHHHTSTSFWTPRSSK